ncbi:hypothetical protein PtrEW7m1_012068, partial [Pyrenophora tritici-repentis]
MEDGPLDAVTILRLKTGNDDGTLPMDRLIVFDNENHSKSFENATPTTVEKLDGSSVCEERVFVSVGS